AARRGRVIRVPPGAGLLRALRGTRGLVAHEQGAARRYVVLSTRSLRLTLPCAAACRYATRPAAMVATTAGPAGSTSTRSARFPPAMLPRSGSLAAAAGFADTSAQACARDSTPRPASAKAARSIAG